MKAAGGRFRIFCSMFVWTFALIVPLDVVVATNTNQKESGEKPLEKAAALTEGEIRIVVPTGDIQILPSLYGKNVKRWILEVDKLIPISGTGMTGDIEGFVNPSSTTNLWWPMDLKQLDARLTLDIVVQGGGAKYVCGGLDSRVHQEEGTSAKRAWRNHGLRSTPMAFQWIPFSAAVLPGFRVKAFLARSKNEDGEAEWGPFLDGDEDAGTSDVRKALQEFSMFWAENQDMQLASGLHMISIPLQQSWNPIPFPADPYVLVAIATAEPDADALLYQSPTKTAAILGVEVQLTAPGGESEHLPDVYKELYA